jgi:hypothetical protein
MSELITVTTAAELNAALESALGGETLCLEAGHYGQLILNAATHPRLAFATPVTLAGVGAPLPAVFSGLHLSGVVHLVFEGIVFDVNDAEPAPHITAPHITGSSADAPFKLVACTDIAFQGCIFNGRSAQADSATDCGPKIGCGLTLSACHRMRIDTCRLQAFSHGIVALGCETLNVLNCNLSAIGMDAMLLIDTKAVRIEGNSIHDLGPQSAPNLPITMLHFRTKTADRSHRDVVVRNNTLDAGSRSAARGIVMTADFGPDFNAESTASPGPVLACERLLIEGNLIVTRHPDGIVLGPLKTVTIQNNSVLMAPVTPDSAGPTVAPQIMIDPRAQDVTVIKNAVFGIVGVSARSNAGPSPMAAWTVRQNAFIQADDPTLPGWYGDVFETLPEGQDGAFSPSSARFVVRKGSMLHSLGAGVLPVPLLKAPGLRDSGLEDSALKDSGAPVLSPPFIPKLVPKLSVVPRLMPPREAIKTMKSAKSSDSAPKRASAPASMAWTSSAFLDCSVPLM